MENKNKLQEIIFKKESKNYKIDTVFIESGILILSSLPSNQSSNIPLIPQSIPEYLQKPQKLLKLNLDKAHSDKINFQFSECYSNPKNMIIQQGNSK